MPHQSYLFPDPSQPDAQAYGHDEANKAPQQRTAYNPASGNQEYQQYDPATKQWNWTGTIASRPPAATNVSVQTQPVSTSAAFTEEEIREKVRKAGGTLADYGVYYRATFPDGTILRFDPSNFPRAGQIAFNVSIEKGGGGGAARATPSPAVRAAFGLGAGAEVSGDLAAPATPSAAPAAAPPPATQPGAVSATGFSPTNPLSHPLSAEQANAALDAFYASPPSNRTINRGLPFSSPWPGGDKELPVTLGGYIEKGGLTPLSTQSLASPNPQFVGTGGLGLDSRAILQAAGLRSSGDPVKDAQLAINVSAARAKGYYPAAGEGQPTTPFMDLATLASGAGGVKEIKAQQNYDYYGNPLPLGPSGFTGRVGVNQDLMYELGKANERDRSMNTFADLQKRQLTAAGMNLSEAQKQQLDYEQMLREQQASQQDLYGARGLNTITTKPTTIHTSEAGQPEQVTVQPLMDEYSSNPSLPFSGRELAGISTPREATGQMAFGRYFGNAGSGEGYPEIGGAEWNDLMWRDQQRRNVAPAPPPMGAVLPPGFVLGPDGRAYSVRNGRIVTIERINPLLNALSNWREIAPQDNPPAMSFPPHTVAAELAGVLAQLKSSRQGVPV